MCFSVALVAACSSSSGSSSSPAASASGLTKVTIFAPGASDVSAVWLADQKGYYKDAGLDVTLDTVNGASGEADIEALVSGAYQFGRESSVSGLIAQQAGAKIVPIFNFNVGSEVLIAVDKDYAKAHGIPSTASTEAQSLAQFEALKGTHITIAMTSATSTPAGFILAACDRYGLTCGFNATNDDIDLESVGSSGAQATGLAAGKFDAVGNLIPNSLLPNTVAINMGAFPPVSQIPNDELYTTEAMIQDHPSTVQDVVNATARAWIYDKSHPAAAKVEVAELQKSAADITNPQEVQTIYSDLSRYWISPLMTSGEYSALASVINKSKLSHITLSYSQAWNPTFAKNADNTLDANFVSP